MQALRAADILQVGAAETENEPVAVSLEKRSYPEGHLRQAQELCEAVRVTLKEQSEDWKRRSLFERQWVIRDFRKTAGMPVEEWLETLNQLEDNLERGTISHPPLEQLAGYYNHLADLARGYEKDTAKLQEDLCHVYRWRDEVHGLEQMLKHEQSN